MTEQDVGTLKRESRFTDEQVEFHNATIQVIRHLGKIVVHVIGDRETRLHAVWHDGVGVEANLYLETEFGVQQNVAIEIIFHGATVMQTACHLKVTEDGMVSSVEMEGNLSGEWEDKLMSVFRDLPITE
ncbi:MAG: hypothetical protein U9Q03_05215 [Patescibacteria group bacterium]|nr:hypothetical protein [Patescibacteria group bacterium]